MKSFLLVGVLSIVAVEPALAQFRTPYPPYSYNYRSDSPRQRLEELVRRIDNDERLRLISPDDARRLRIEVNRLLRVEWEYGHDGFSSWERTDLARQIARLRDRVLGTEQGRFGDRSVIVPPQGYRDGRRWEDRNYDPRDQYRYDNRGYDRDEDRDSGRLDRGDDRGSGLDFGRADPGDDQGDPVYESGGGDPEQLRVGDRAPANLGLLPPDLRSRYRDGDGIYYRYQDGSIYLIDEKTGLIRWIGRPWN